jgi:hypothetical protein
VGRKYFHLKMVTGAMIFHAPVFQTENDIAWSMVAGQLQAIAGMLVLLSN